MGVIHHHAVLATVYNKDSFDKMKKWIEDELKVEPSILGVDPKRLFIYGGGIANDYHTIVLVPDGSKEGWPDSAVGDRLRELFIAKLESMAYDDGSNSWHWVEVGYGECGQQIRGNNRNEYA